MLGGKKGAVLALLSEFQKDFLKMTTLVAEVAEYKTHGQTDRLAFCVERSPVVFNCSNIIF